MAATDGEAPAAHDKADPPRDGARLNPFLAAALALPGVVPAAALAQSMPDQGLFALQYLDYRDWQPGADRMSVRSPSLYVLAPFAERCTVEGSLVYDAMSGASPLYFNTLSGASGLGRHRIPHRRRRQGHPLFRPLLDRRRRRVFARARLTSRARARSTCAGGPPTRTRRSRSASPATSDYIHPSARELDNGRRHTLDFLVGITQSLSPVDIVQSNLTYFDRPWLLLRSVQAARHAARRSGACWRG